MEAYLADSFEFVCLTVSSIFVLFQIYLVQSYSPIQVRNLKRSLKPTLDQRF